MYVARTWLSMMHSQSEERRRINFFSSESKKLYSLFLLVNFLVPVIVILIPVKAQVENYAFLAFINLSFCSLVLLLSLIVEKFKVRKVDAILTIQQIRNIRRNIFLCCFGSIFGLAMVAYDRVYVRGIDYMQGLRAARYEWLASDGGSLVSMAGNLLIPFSYVGLFLVVINSKFFTSKAFLFYVFLALLVIFGHAALNGGRSNILLGLLVMVLAFLLRPGRINYKAVIKALLLIVLLSVPAFFYVAEIIKSSASMGGVDLSTLLSRAITGLQGRFVEGYVVQERSQLELLLLYIISYLSHGQWTAQVIGDLSSMPGSYFLYPFSVILARLSLLSEPLQPGIFSDVGAFVSLPAAIYYDFGFLGLFAVSSFIGGMFGLTLAFLKDRSRMSGWKLGLFVYFGFIVLLSPIIPAYGFSYLNFIVFSFFVVGLLNRIFYGKGYRLI